MNEPREKDFLVYTGNKFPRILRFAWTVFFLFAAYYLILNFFPDLKTWMHK